MSKNQIITLVGKSYAKEGFKFYFNKPRTDICPKSCRFYTTCMINLSPRCTYSVVKILGIEHMCPYSYHDEESMSLVEVDLSPIEIIMEIKKIFLGAVVSFNLMECSEKDCLYSEYCAPIKGLVPGEKIKIIDVVKKIGDNKCTDNKISIVRVEKI